MKNFLYLLVIILFFGCQAAKDGFSLKKDNNSDEFLVEKKNPLVLPPDYNTLPTPDNAQESSVEKNDDVKKMISMSQNNTIQEKKESSNNNLEKSILEKID